MRTEFIDTGEGTAFVCREGSGPTVVVLHGGPGFDHRYMRQAVGFLASGRTLVYYDQPGCGRTPAPASGPSLEHTARHARAVICEVARGRPIGVIAHSWGALVHIALRDMEAGAPPLPELDCTLLINPLPLTRAGYDAIRKNFTARISLSSRLRILARALRGAGGASVMELLMPYYMADGSAGVSPPMPLALGTYLTVSRRLGAFDFSGGLAQPHRLAVIHGAEDFTTRADIGDIAAAAAVFHDMAGVGHFPFFEARAGFRKLVRRIFA